MRIAYAQEGQKKGKEWQLSHIQETQFQGDKISTTSLPSESLGVVFEPMLVKHAKKDVDQESIYTLFHNILYRERAGLVTSQYQYAFWKRIIQPITTIVMICLGIPFIFGSLRSASMGFRIMTGVIIYVGLCYPIETNYVIIHLVRENAHLLFIFDEKRNLRCSCIRLYTLRVLAPCLVEPESKAGRCDLVRF